MAECQAIRIRFSTSKSEGMDITWKKVDCTFWVQDGLLYQVEKFSYLKFLVSIGILWCSWTGSQSTAEECRGSRGS